MTKDAKMDRFAESGKGEPSSLPYFPFYGRDFRDGVRRLKEDEVGIYVLVLTLIYESYFGAIPDNDADIAKDMGRSVRVWRRVRARLLELRKLELRDGWLSNPRADRVIEDRNLASEARIERARRGGEASAKSRREKSVAEVSPKFPESFPKVSPKLSQNSDTELNEISDVAELKAEAESESDITASQLARARDPRPLDRCIAAAGPGLGDPSKYASLHLTAPRIAAAIAAGCDLELDILPVIAARTAKPRASPITSWTYFERAWADARDQRLAAFAASNPSRFAGATNGNGHRKSAGRGSGSFVEAGQRLLNRAGPPDDLQRGDEGEPIEGEVIAPRRIGAGG